MKQIRRKLTRVIGLYDKACGHEGPLQKADYERLELERLIEDSLNSTKNTEVTRE